MDEREGLSDRVAKAESGLFCETALRKGFVTAIQVRECQGLGASPEWAGKTAAEILVAKGHISRSEVELVLGEILPPPVPQIVGYAPLVPGGWDRFGRLFASRHLGTGLDVSIRILGVKAEQAAFDRLKTEIRSLTALAHPALISLLDAGLVGNELFVASEPIQDPTLVKTMEACTPVAEEQVRATAGRLIEGLMKLKDSGFCHGGVAPELIVQGKDSVRLALPGLVWAIHKAVPAIINDFGARAYFAPEQLEGQVATSASDVYSLGLVLYQLAAGFPAFAGSPASVAQAKKAGQYVPLHQAAPKISKGLSFFVSELLQPDPAKRPQSREQLAKCLEMQNPPAPGKKPATLRTPLKGEGEAQARPRPIIVRTADRSSGAGTLLLLAVGLAALGAVIFFATKGSPSRTESGVPGKTQSAQSRPSGSAAQKPIGEAPRPTQTPEQAQQVFAAIRGRLIDQPLARGDFSEAYRALGIIEQTNPGMGAFAPMVRESILREAQRDLEANRARLQEASAAGKSLDVQRITSLVKSRYKGIPGMEQQVDEMLKALAGPPRPGETPPLAPGPIETAKEPPIPFEPTKKPATESLPPPIPNNQILNIADRSLEEAKKEFEEGKARNSAVLLNDALGKADKARTGFEALQDVLVGQDLDHVTYQSRQSVQLIRLIRDALKSAPGGPAPPPITKKSIPPPPAAKIDPGVIETWRDLLTRFALGEAFVLAEEAPKARSSAIKVAGRNELVSAVTAIIGIAEEDPARVPVREKTAIVDYLKKYDWKQFPAMTDKDHLKAVMSLKDARAKVLGTAPAAGQALFLLEMVHINRVLHSNAAEPSLVSLCRELGLSPPDPQTKWILATPSGLVMARARDLGEGTDAAVAELKKSSGGDPELGLFRAYQQLANLMGKPLEEKKRRWAEVAAVFRELHPPERFRKAVNSVADAMKRKIPCSACKGDHSIRCSDCDKGERVAVCNLCGGNPIKRPCPACGDKAKWKVKCLRCSGTGQVECRQCKAAWIEPSIGDLLTSDNCGACRQTGFVFDAALLPCPDCAGIGFILQAAR